MHDSFSELGSITRLYEEAKHGDSDAACGLWVRYADRLSALAAATLKKLDIAEIDGSGESVANAAFQKFMQALAEGRYVDVENRDGLWRLLATITQNSAKSRAKSARTYRGHLANAARGAKEVRDNQKEINPETAAMVADTIEQLIRQIDHLAKDEEQVQRFRLVLKLALAGYSQEEIAARIDRSSATVRRNLRTIGHLLRQLDPLCVRDLGEADTTA